MQFNRIKIIYDLCVISEFLNYDIMQCSIEIDLFYIRIQTQSFNEALLHYVKGSRNDNTVSRNIKNCLLSVWFDIGAFITLLLIFPSILILLHNINNTSLPSYYHGVSAANIPSGGVNEVDEKHSSIQDKLSFQVVLPGVTLPMSDIGYYMMALLFCSVVHEAGHAIAAIQEGINNVVFMLLDRKILVHCP